MVSAGRAYLLDAPHVSLFPGIAIFLTLMGFNCLGDGLRDALTPDAGPGERVRAGPTGGS